MRGKFAKFVFNFGAHVQGLDEFGNAFGCYVGVGAGECL